MLNFKLENKSVFLFSSQAWGNMLLSKHHYAITLAKRGNKVYFINPPLNHFAKVKVDQSEYSENLFIVSFGFPGIQRFRFHVQYVFSLLNKFNIYRVKNNTVKRPDIVWNFDFNGYCNYDMFPHSVKIAHPVDFIPKNLKKNLKGADIMFSVATEIVEDLEEFKIPGFFVNHAVHKGFIAKVSDDVPTKKRTQVGYVGNLLRPDINHELILKLVSKNGEIDFNFIGNYEMANVGGVTDEEKKSFITKLKHLPNAILHGVQKKENLVVLMNQMDMFLICYDPQKDFCKGVNYHKVMEYLATGKVIVSNHVTTYEGKSLLEMNEKNGTDEEFVRLFDKVKLDLNLYNSENLMNKRKEFAFNHTYEKQIGKIEEKMSELLNSN